MKTLLTLCLGCFLLTKAVTTRAADAPNFTRVEDVIYGRKYGTALTMDVFKPTQTNNACGVIFMVSGGFSSGHEFMNLGFFRPFLDRGYTVFAVVHGSQPKFVIPEIEEDIHRAVRFIRHNAAAYGVDPHRLGITGASSGGHLTLTIATQGRPSRPEASDPVDKESSVVQAAACFFPPTDFLNWGADGVDAVGVGPLAGFKPAFGPRSDTPESRQIYGKDISPLNFLTANLPPTLIIHGTADRLVPLQQSQIFVKRANDLHVAHVKLIEREGKDHGWPGIEKELAIFADWFDVYLRGLPAKE